MSKLPFTLLFLCFSIIVSAQRDTVAPRVFDNEIDQDLIEDFIQNQESDANFDYNTIFEQLDAFQQNPININSANAEELQALGLLTELQIVQLLQYRNRAGQLIAIQELQAVPGFDLKTIRMILPFVTISGAIDDFQVPIKEMISGGTDELFIRWSSIVETQKGYTPLTEGQTGSRFLGDPNRLYVRYKHSFDNRFRFGFTAEKDPGEDFFSGSNPGGFDFYSAHLFLKDYNKTIKAIAIGDYSISFGQGLILYSGFGSGKGSQIMNIKRSRWALMPYSSVDENDFLRGVGTTLRFGNKLEFTAFGSLRQRDANILQIDTLDQEESLIRFSSLQGSGLHRTASEIEDEDALQQFSLGGQLKYQQENWHLAFNTLFDRFDKSLERNLQAYNQFYFNGQQLANASLDYSFIVKNLNFFGETAISSNGVLATSNGLLMTLARNVDFAILHRYFPRDYQALNANPVAETSGAINENGLYLGTVIRFNRFWKLGAYFDIWEHPWLRFNADAPSKGYEYRARLSYYLKRKLEAYFEIRNQWLEINSSDPEVAIDYLVPVRLSQARFHLNNIISKSIELRSRIDFGFFDDGESDQLQKGFLIYQDILFKPLSFPLSFTGRFALFDTDGYNIRYYAYENDLLFSFSIPAYYHKGTRFYLNLRYKGIRNMTLEFRYARTYWSKQDQIGSGLDTIDGSTRTELKAQVKYKF